MDERKQVDKMAVEVKRLLLDQITNFTSNLTHKAVLTIDGIEKDYDIFRTKIENGKVRKFVYLGSGAGHVTNARLIDNARRDLYISDSNIAKTEDGLMIVIDINISVKGGATR